MANTINLAAEQSAAPQSAALDGIQKAVEALTAQLAQLNANLARMQFPAVLAAPAAGLAPAAAAAAPEALAATPGEEIAEETLLAISAAIAAYLGKRPRIRAIRLVQGRAWAQQGRVFVQASHQLNVAHDA
jgi:methylmalonyl-CoA carboxyltransferase large subunit